jgi:hypothetical protein
MSMEVDVYDGVITAPGGAGSTSSWTWWITDWEYVSLTIIPLSTNASVQIISQGVSSDPAGKRTLFFTVLNNTNNDTLCFITVTIPASSVR